MTAKLPGSMERIFRNSRAASAYRPVLKYSAASELIDNGCGTLLIDLEGTRIINSIGVSILLEIMEKLLDDKGQLAFCNLTPTISKTFEIMGLVQYATIFPDRDTARHSLMGDPTV